MAALQDGWQSETTETTETTVSFEQGNIPYSGIIGNAGAGSVIKNLTADSVTITTRGDYASCIVGYSAGTLTNLKVTQGYVKSYGLHSGLVVGYLNEGAIDNCTSAMSTSLSTTA